MSEQRTTCPTHIPALGENLAATARTLVTHYEPTHGDGITVQARRRSVPPSVHDAIAARVRMLEAALQPQWQIRKLKARVPVSPHLAGTVEVDQLCRDLVQFGRAAEAVRFKPQATCHLHATVTATAGEASTLDADFRVADEASSHHATLDPRLELFAQVGIRGWIQVVQNVIGAWCVASGVTELQLVGDLADQPRGPH